MWYIIVVIMTAGQPVEMPKVGGYQSLSQCSANLSSFVAVVAAESDLSFVKVGCEKKD